MNEHVIGVSEPLLLCLPDFPESAPIRLIQFDASYPAILGSFQIATLEHILERVWLILQ